MPDPLFVGVTIDPPGSPDRDDAIWVDKHPSGWLVTVCIANVADAVPLGSEIDTAAQEQGATIYDLGGVGHQHMLPYELVERQLSLNSPNKRRALAFRFKVAREGKTKLLTMEQGNVEPLANLTWGDFAATAERDSSFAGWLEMAGILREQRRVPLSSQRFQRYGSRLLQLTAPGKPPQPHTALRAVGLVEELMILTNHAVAVELAESAVPFLLRTHGTHTRHDRVVVDQHTGKKVVRFCKESPRAVYEPRVGWHSGLRLPKYAHITSPIRRYADLVNQRILVAHLRQQQPPYTPEELAKIGAHLTERTTQIEAFYRRFERTEEEAQAMRPSA